MHVFKNFSRANSGWAATALTNRLSCQCLLHIFRAGSI